MSETERLIKRMAELDHGINEAENALTKYAIELNECTARLRRITLAERKQAGK